MTSLRLRQENSCRGAATDAYVTSTGASLGDLAFSEKTVVLLSMLIIYPQHAKAKSTMELKEFIAETLVQIQEGVQEAIQRRSSSVGLAGVINPVFGTDMNSASYDHVQKVEFDVAVTVTDKTSGGGKAGIKVFSIELGGDLTKAAEHSVASHIKFVIPVIPPVQLVKPIDD